MPMLFTKTAVAQGGGTDIVRGRVVDEKGAPIAEARVTVIDSVGATRKTKTNKDGRFTAIFQGGSGHYSVNVVSMGKAPANVSISRKADEEVLIANISMAPSAAATSNAQHELDAVKVLARRKPDREEGPFRNANPGDKDEALERQQFESDLEKLAGQVPGMRLTPDGLSVFGGTADQNNSTLNGMSFNGGKLPAGVAMSGLSTATYDASRGGFSGGQFSSYVPAGQDYVSRNLTISLDAPFLQGSNIAAQQLGQKYTNMQFNYAGSGPLIEDKIYYNGGIRYGRRWNDLVALNNIGPEGSLAVGVPPDSIQRLVSSLRAAGIPVTPSALPGSQLTSDWSALYRIDWRDKEESERAFNILASLQHSSSQAVGASPTSFLSQAGVASSMGGSLQAQYSSYFHDMFLSDLRFSVSLNRSDNDPYVHMPAGSVLIGSRLSDGSLGSSYLGFGGGLSTSRSNNWSVEGEHELSWLSLNNKHRLKFTSDLQLSGTTSRSFSNPYGTYAFNSLSDFDALTPTSFTRTIGSRNADARGATIGLSLGDAWRPAERFQMQYGVRMDADRIFTRPGYNAALDSVLQVRTDVVPNKISFSPRIGFMWLPFWKPPVPGQGPMMISFAGFSQTTVRGGFGLFTNALRPEEILGAAGATGLPSGPLQLTCLGSAIPTPPADLYASDPSAVPSQCLNGNAPSVFSELSPSVFAFDPTYSASRSWRSTLSFSRTTNRYSLSLDGVYSLGVNTPGFVDVNFANVQQFTLPGEGNRPMFVSPGSIVLATGAVSPVESRRTSAYTTVQVQQSDLRNSARQLTINLSPQPKYRPNGLFIMPQFGYTIGTQRSLERGFTGSTGGDPVATTWGRGGGDIRHQFNLNAYMGYRGMSISLFGSIRSGAPFTPMVAGDINGDGYANDRAFIPNPATITDPTLKNNLTTLLSTVDHRTADCLRKQFGTIAGRNSCTGPWSQSLSGSIDIDGAKFHLPRRVRVSGYFSNLLGGLDQLFHGDNLHGWGEQNFADATLLIPKAFDPTTRQFSYDVNPRFGVQKFSRTRFGTPFSFTLNTSIELAPSPTAQMAHMMIRDARPGKGRDSLQIAMELRQRLSFSNRAALTFMVIHQQKDSLGLTPDQDKAFTDLERETAAVNDSMGTPIVEALMHPKSKLNDADIIDMMRALRTKANEYYKTIVVPRLNAIIPPAQMQKMPEMIRNFITNPDFMRDDYY